MRREDKLYQIEFGEIPDDVDGRVSYILGNKANNEKFNQAILIAAKEISRIKYTKLTFTMWKTIRPSSRPKANGRAGYIRMYVPGAHEDGEWFKEFAKEAGLPYIETPCILNMKIYGKTPSSFNTRNKVLAEMGFIRPWKRTGGDFDNLAKNIGDMVQHGLLKDDALVIESKQELFFSIKPHAEIEIKYMNKMPKVY